MFTETTRTVPTTGDGVGLNVRVFSDSSASTTFRDVLLLHGWPNSGRVWRPLAELLLLADPSFRLVAPDFRGFGDSEKATTGYACATFADDAVAVADALELRLYAVVGHSMGGKIAQLLASRQPFELAGLALVAPVPLAAPPSPTPDDKKQTQRSIFGDAEKTRALLAGFAAHPLDASEFVEDGLRAAPEAWNGWIDPMRDEDFAAEAAKIAVPTLVIAGEKDPLRAPDLLRSAIADRIPNAQFATIPAVGHLPHRESPEALASLLVNFLDTLRQPTQR